MWLAFPNTTRLLRYTIGIGSHRERTILPDTESVDIHRRATTAVTNQTSRRAAMRGALERGRHYHIFRRGAGPLKIDFRGESSSAGHALRMCVVRCQHQQGRPRRSRPSSGDSHTRRPRQVRARRGQMGRPYGKPQNGERGSARWISSHRPAYQSEWRVGANESPGNPQGSPG